MFTAHAAEDDGNYDEGEPTVAVVEVNRFVAQEGDDERAAGVVSL